MVYKKSNTNNGNENECPHVLTYLKNSFSCKIAFIHSLHEKGFYGALLNVIKS